VPSTPSLNQTCSCRAARDQQAQCADGIHIPTAAVLNMRVHASSKAPTSVNRIEHAM